MVMVRVWQAMAIVVTVLSGACNGTDYTATDAGTHDAAAGDSMVDADAATGIPSCGLEDRRECVPSQFYRLQPLLAASTFGTDARFAALDGDAVIAQRGSGPDVLARVFPWDSSTPAEIVELPENFLSIDLAMANTQVFVIGCDSTACRLVRVEAHEGVVHEVADSTLPFSVAPRGITQGRHYSDELGEYWPCVYGEGLWCFDGTEWHVDLADESLVAATLLTPQVALTTDGRVWFRPNDDGDWTPVLTILSSQPRWVDNHDGGNSPRAGLLLDDNTWGWINADGTASQCELASSYAALRAVPGSGIVVGLSEGVEGSFYSQWHNQTTSFLCTNPDIPLDSLIDISSATCGIISNVRILTTDAFWGTSFCAIY